jgi:hypothetical protein
MPVKPGTAREAVLEALERLERSAGRAQFGVNELVAEVLRVTTKYRESTIRTYVTSVMCKNAPIHHQNHTDDLERVSYGLYQRVIPVPTDERAGSRASMSRDEASNEDLTPLADDREWFWEGMVQAVLIRELERIGWVIESKADTHTRESGVDVLARRGDRTLAAEVKGYPSPYYARGPKSGTAKPTQPATQARHWFSGAVLAVMLLRAKYPLAEVAIALPDYGTYRSLAKRTMKSLEAMEVAILFVARTGSIEQVSGRGILSKCLR